LADCDDLYPLSWSASKGQQRDKRIKVNVKPLLLNNNRYGITVITWHFWTYLPFLPSIIFHYIVTFTIYHCMTPSAISTIAHHYL